MSTVPPRVRAADVRRLDVAPDALPGVPRPVAPTVLIVPDVVPVHHDAVARRLRESAHAVQALGTQLAGRRAG